MLRSLGQLHDKIPTGVLHQEMIFAGTGETEGMVSIPRPLLLEGGADGSSVICEEIPLVIAGAF